MKKHVLLSILMCAILILVLCSLPAFSQDLCQIRSESGELGTGFFVSETEIITANHVVDNGKFRVELGMMIFEASVDAIDLENDTALVVITKPLKVKIAEFGDGEVGNQVEMRGYPGSKWSPVAMHGQIFGKTLLYNTQSERWRINHANIPGMSGGPVVVNGLVIGFICENELQNGTPVAAFIVPSGPIKRLIIAAREKRAEKVSK